MFKSNHRIKNLNQAFSRWKESKNYKHDLDILLEQIDPKASLHDRLLSVVHLMEWIRYQASSQDYSEIKNVKIPAARIRFLLMVLERNQAWKANLAKTLRSVIRDVSALDLFSEIGLPQEFGFWSEFKNRLLLKIMPEKPLREGMGNLFSAMFPSWQDVRWLASLDPNVLNQLIELFHFQVDASEQNWNGLHNDIEEAVLCLVSQVRATGLNSMLRKRMGEKSLKEIPFFKLTTELDQIIFVQGFGSREEFIARCKEYRKLIWSCTSALKDVYRHLNHYGVNVTIVYHLEAANAKLKRIDDLISFMMLDQLDPEIILYFIIQLVQENQDRKSLRALFDQNTRLLARKIVDRSAETGEHYITRTKEEFRKMFKRAAGGGFYTAFTVYIKFGIVALHSSLFIEGFLASINYAVSFLAIQFSGFTLATKQPSMTASALASKMQNIDTGESIEPLIEEIIFLIRTQVVGIIGNVGIVFPTALIMDLVYSHFAGHHLITEEKAHGVLQSTSILSGTPLFAAFTGVLLWASSVFAGWMDNWFVFNNMTDTIKYNRRLNFVFGKETCEKIGLFFQKNVSAISANVSLGFLLGLIPEITKFLGLNLEVRHVTLSSGSVGAAVSYFGLIAFEMKEFWLAVAGIFTIATLNVLVSFSLAFLVAVRSRNIRAIQRGHIYKALLKRFMQRPVLFFYPKESVLKVKELDVGNEQTNQSSHSSNRDHTTAE